MYQDPETSHLQVLLIELMDDSLTNFLEKSPKSVSYHLQVSICHDVASALSYLHSKNIVNKNVCSNNILLTDHVSVTPVYMPPEAMTDTLKKVTASLLVL